MAQIIYPLSIGAIETGTAVLEGASVGEALSEGAYAVGTVFGADMLEQGRRKFFKTSDTTPIPKRKMGMITQKNAKKKRRKKSRVPRALTTFPKEQVFKLKSTHLVTLDPAATGAVAYAEVNINRPYNPFEVGVNFTNNSGEHKPRYWDLLADILYTKFTPLVTKVTVEFLDSANVENHSIFMVAASDENSEEVKGVLNDAILGGVELREQNNDAIVRFISTSSAVPGHHVLSKTVNIRKLEGIKTEEASLLTGNTSSAGTEAAPARSSKLYFGVGAVSSVNLTAVNCIVTMEQTIRFSDLTPDVAGAVV